MAPGLRPRRIGQVVALSAEEADAPGIARIDQIRSCDDAELRLLHQKRDILRRQVVGFGPVIDQLLLP